MATAILALENQLILVFIFLVNFFYDTLLMHKSMARANANALGIYYFFATHLAQLADPLRERLWINFGFDGIKEG